MVTFDQLFTDKREIIELLLHERQSYGQLSERLGIPASEVREVARDALMELAPVTGERVDADWRGKLADYILGQQTARQAIDTHAYLRRSEAARSWARSLFDCLHALYKDGPPSIPPGRRGATPDRWWSQWVRRRAAAVAMQPLKDLFGWLRGRRGGASMDGECSVCSASFAAMSETTLVALGWRISGDVTLCGACQSNGWQLPDGARLPHLPSPGSN